MKQYRPSAHVIANKVRQKRQIYRNAVFLIVEGEDDERFFKRFVDSTKCRIQPAYGRPNVEEALAILEEDLVPHILAITDADFDALEGRSPQSPNLLRTDTHDIETMMLRSPALEHVLGELGDDDTITAFEAQAGHSIREALLAAAIPIGLLRWLSQRKQLAYRFEDLPLDQACNRKTLQMDQEALVATIENHSRIGIVDRELVTQDIASLQATSPDPWQLCCGHDMVAILALGLQRALGKQNKAEVNPKRLEAALRLAYELAYFTLTQLHAAIRRWEAGHQPILKSPGPAPAS